MQKNLDCADIEHAKRMYLLERRYPDFELHTSEGHLRWGPTRRAELTRDLREILSYWNCLCSLSAEELSEQCQRARMAARSLSQREQALFRFDDPSNDADYGHWATLPYWTPEEATALLLGKDPNRLKGVVVKHLVECSTFAARFRDLYDLTRRAIEAGDLESNIAPPDFLVWAGERGLNPPQELTEAVNSKPHGPSWQARHNEVKQRLSEYESRPTDGRNHPKQRATDATLIIGMAEAHYGYEADAVRSSTANRIAEDLQARGYAISADTVRNALNCHKDGVRHARRAPG